MSELKQPIDEQDKSAQQHQPLRLEQYLRAMATVEASDLHLKANLPPQLRLNGLIRAMKADPLSGQDIYQMAMEMLSPRQKAFFGDHGSIDIAHDLEGSNRFRINIFRQRGQTSISVRRVSRQIPSFEKLNLPPIMEKIAQENNGLVLLSGATGSGKSTTIAAMIEYINKTRPCHIVTIEDPIEFVFEDKRALVSQREVGIDVESFESALKYLMREDPDVVLIGEMRDRETFQAALQASETGHLVFGTVHASSAGQTVGRILDLFDPQSRDLVRQSLAFNLRAVVCQKLLPCLLEGVDRLPAVEILLGNPSVRKLLEEAREGELGDIIRNHEREGMQSFTRSLLELVTSDKIDPKIAYEVAPSADELKMLLKGISASRPGFLNR